VCAEIFLASIRVKIPSVALCFILAIEFVFIGANPWLNFFAPPRLCAKKLLRISRFNSSVVAKEFFSSFRAENF
jgi:hypothetical protein